MRGNAPCPVSRGTPITLAGGAPLTGAIAFNGVEFTLSQTVFDHTVRVRARRRFLMHSPIPGPFHGSIPSPDHAGAQHARLLDASFSALALLAAAGVWAGATLSGPQGDMVAVAKVSCVVLLITALTGMWLIERSAEMPRLGVTLLIESLRHRWDRRAARRAVALSPKETPARGLAGLLEGFSSWLNRLGETPAPVQEAAPDRHVEAQRLVAALYQEADSLSDTSNDIEESGRRLLGDVGGAEHACNQTQSALSRMTDRVVALTGAVSRTTAEAERVSAAGVELSELAFKSQQKIAVLDDRTASLLADIEHIERLLGRVGGLTESTYITGSRLGERGTPVVTLALELRDLGATALASILGIEATLAEMGSQAAAATKAAEQIGTRVHAQHELGLGLSHAVLQQSAEIAEIMRMLDEAQAGCLTLRASVEAVTRHGLARSVQTAKLREAAGRLPTHADNVASVLRGIPDFAPRIDFEY
jgi:hypothetical protein